MFPLVQLVYIFTCTTSNWTARTSFGGLLVSDPKRECLSFSLAGCDFEVVSTALILKRSIRYLSLGSCNGHDFQATVLLMVMIYLFLLCDLVGALASCSCRAAAWNLCTMEPTNPALWRSKSSVKPPFHLGYTVIHGPLHGYTMLYLQFMGCSIL